MKNNFFEKDIKNSVEYGWRKNTVKGLLIIWAVVAAVLLFAVLIASVGDMQYIGLSLEIWLIVVGIYGAALLPFVAFYGYKMLYLLKHYEQFDSYEVVLDKVSTSYMYRGAVYYTVTVDVDGVSRWVDTNACFSGGVFAKFPLDEYNNKKVVGLYDSQMDKFYIIKKVS